MTMADVLTHPGHDARTDQEPVLAFDIGGTWFRVAVVGPGGQVRLLERRPAIGRSDPAQSLDHLVGELVRYLVDRTGHFGTPSGSVGISLGAAMDMNTGEVLASAPLWGPGECRVDLEEELSRRMPSVRWSVVNDVSALAIQLAAQSADAQGWVAALTVSSGIAYRLIDVRSGYIPRDPEFGLQGEIGHLPTDVGWRGTPINLACDCGAFGHVSAFSSGPGIVATLRTLHRMDAVPDHYFGPAGSPDSAVLEHFSARVAAHHTLALEILRAITRPIALVLLYQATLNPEVTRTVLSGGVVDGLGAPYLEALLDNLSSLGLYHITQRNEDYFRRRVFIAASDGLDALRGAALFARQHGIYSNSRPDATADRRTTHADQAGGFGR